MNNIKVQGNLIFDVGMHNGKDTRFYLDKGFNVIAIEASPISCIDAEKMFANEITSGQLKIYNKAISDTKGTVTFVRYKNHDDWSSIVPDWNRSMYKEEVETFQIETTNIDEIIEKEGLPYYIKIDIEGSDILCLNALKKIDHLPKYVSVELLSINNLKTDNKPDYLEILCTLRSLGYTKFQLVDQSKHDSTVCPKPAREGNYIDTKFDGFSSGLFGKELPDNWVTIDDVIFDYLLYAGKQVEYKVENEIHGLKKRFSSSFFNPTVRLQQKLDVNGWFDVHATY